MGCLICCVEAFEAFIKFIAHGAYIQIALTGNSFCTAAHDAFYLAVRHPKLFTAVEILQVMVTIVGRLLIAGATALICWVIFTKAPQYDDEISAPIFPCLFIFLINFFVADMIMGVLDTAGDSIL